MLSRGSNLVLIYESVQNSENFIGMNLVVGKVMYPNAYTYILKWSETGNVYTLNIEITACHKHTSVVVMKNSFLPFILVISRLSVKYKFKICQYFNKNCSVVRFFKCIKCAIVLNFKNEVLSKKKGKFNKTIMRSETHPLFLVFHT